MKKHLVVILAAFAALIIIGVGVTIAVKGGGKNKTASDDDYVLIIGQGVEGSLCQAPFYIAFEQKLFEEEGLNYDIFRMDIGTGMNHLTTGAVDVSVNLMATVIQPIANGLDIKIPLAIHTGCVKILTKKTSGIKTVKDLKGKKIGVESMNSSRRVVPSRVLATEGLKPEGYNSDVEWVIFPASELPLALERDFVDAIGLGEPAASIIEAEGNVRVIIDSASDHYLKDEFCCVVTARSKVVEEHPEAVAKYLRALQKAAKFVQENPDETARIITEKKYVPGEVATNAIVLKTFNYKASVSEALIALENNIRDLQKIGLVAADIDADSVIKNTFIAIPGVPDSLYKK